LAAPEERISSPVLLCGKGHRQGKKERMVEAGKVLLWGGESSEPLFGDLDREREKGRLAKWSERNPSGQRTPLGEKEVLDRRGSKKDRGKGCLYKVGGMH